MCSNLLDALHFRQEVFEQVLNPVLQRGGRGGAAGAGAFHAEIDDSVAKTLERDVAAIAGRTRVSIRSLIVSTISASAELKNSSPSGAASPVRIGAPERKNSVTTPSTAGRRCCHSPSVLVTEMKSGAKNTPPTPGSSIRALASGERSACSGSRASNVPASKTARPGRNFSVAGFGVASV